MADVVVTAASVLAGANAKTRWAVAAVAITIGQVVYEDSATSFQVRLADANASAATSVAAGIALTAASGANQPILIDTEDDDFTPGFTLVLTGASDDGTYVLSSTPGAF